MASLPTTGDAARVLSPRDAEEQTRMVLAVDRFAEFVRLVNPAIRRTAERIALSRGSVCADDPETAVVSREDVLRAGWVVAENAAAVDREVAGLREDVVRRAEDIAEDFDPDGTTAEPLVVSDEAFGEVVDVIESAPPLSRTMREAIRSVAASCGGGS